ncbi:MAG: hypothetical protein AAGD00_05625 [Planctomycetota bacterium]
MARPPRDLGPAAVKAFIRQSLSETRIEERGIRWMSRVRLRVAALIVGIPLAAFGVLSLGVAGWLTLPVVGVAIAAVSVGFSKATSRLAADTCWTCGTSLADEPASEHGVMCPKCGALNQQKLG